MLFMPRKATPTQDGVAEAIGRINAYRQRSSLSTLSLAKQSKVSQPALARFLNGERKTLTPTARIVLEFIENGHERHNWHSHARLPPVVEDAVRTILDGGPQFAEALASVIRALKPVIDAAAVQRGDRRSRGAG